MKPIERTLDGLWSELIRLPGCCEVCGRSDRRLDAHHIVPRRYKRTRWLRDNGVCLCAGPGGHHDWAHLRPQEFEDWVKDHFGELALSKLWETARHTHMAPYEPLEKARKRLTAELRRAS